MSWIVTTFKTFKLFLATYLMYKEPTNVHRQELLSNCIQDTIQDISIRIDREQKIDHRISGRISPYERFVYGGGRHAFCIVAGCTSQPSFNRTGERDWETGIYCAVHKPMNTVDVKEEPEKELKENVDDHTDTKCGEDDSDDIRCVVCTENKRCIIFIPCVHSACCIGCAKQITECPICRSTFEKKLFFHNA